MNAKTFVSAIALSFAAVGAAQATAPAEPNNTPFEGVYGQAVDSASRAQVLTELQQARAAGLTGVRESNNTPFTARADSGVSRAEVLANIDNGNTSTSIAFGDLNNQPFQGV